MTITNIELVEGTLLTTSAATYGTHVGNTKTVIRRATFCNTTANARLVTIYKIPNGGTAVASTTFVKDKVLGPNETWSCVDLEGHVLEANGFIQALCDAGSAVAITVSAYTVT